MHVLLFISKPIKIHYNNLYYERIYIHKLLIYKSMYIVKQKFKKYSLEPYLIITVLDC